jgi:hypothetical protein
MKIALAALIALLTAVPARAGVWIGFEGYLSDGVDYRIEPDPRREGELQAYGRVMGAYGRACQQHLQWCLEDLIPRHSDDLKPDFAGLPDRGFALPGYDTGGSLWFGGDRPFDYDWFRQYTPVDRFNWGVKFETGPGGEFY